MEIPFRSEFDSMRWAFTLNFEPQQLGATYDNEMSYLHTQASIKREVHSNEPQNLFPVILELHGRLSRVNDYSNLGARLLPIEDMPINLASSAQLVNLSFSLSKHYIQQLEEERKSLALQNLNLVMRMWGVAAMMSPRANTPGVPEYLQSHSGEVIRFEKVFTDQSSSYIQIERSAWIDRILPGLGYRRSVLIELPLIRTPPLPDAYKNAAEALDAAQRAFDQEDYRGAVKHARDVLDYVAKSSQGGQITSFCKEYIEPLVGGTKSQAIDRSLNALREVVNAGSHLDPTKPFVVDRNIAAYVIETLALNLRYISSVLG